MKITKSQLRQLIKEEVMNEIGQVSDINIDMEDLALVYDEEFGPDYVIGIMASEFPALDKNEAAFEKALGMFKEAARRGKEDYPVNFLAERFAELMNKMGGLEEALPPHLQKHFRKDGSSVHGPEIKDVTPAGYGPEDPKEAMLRQIVSDKQRGKVEGVMVDLFTASAIVSVLDAINDANKDKLLALPVDRMADIAFKMMK